MADLKPIGSEKLKGKEKLNRIMEIARFNETIPSTSNDISKSEYSINLADGNNYQIVKERQGYVIKKTISESELDYIEPMKNRKYYSSYSQALKRLNLLTKEINRLNENEEGTSLFGEQKKFVLKTPKPAPAPEAEAAPPAEPPAVPSPELPPSPLGDEAAMGAEAGMEDMGGEAGMEDMGGEAGMEDMGGEAGMEDMGGEAGMEDMGGEEGGEDVVTFKTIQKLTGKLTQKIRTLDNQEGMTSEDIKYVINMVLSSLDLAKLSEEDKESILAKFEDIESEEGMEDMGTEDMGMENPEEDMTSDAEVEDVQASMDVPVEGEMAEDFGTGAIFDSIFAESKVDKVISKYFEISKKEILENQKKNAQKKKNRLVEVKKQMNQVVKLTESIEQELAVQKFLEENTNSVFVGKTNKKNLVIESRGKQIKISPQGLLV